MTVASPNLQAQNLGCCLDTLAMEHELVRRYASALLIIYAGDHAWRVPAAVSRMVMDFADDFIEDWHHVREDEFFAAILSDGPADMSYAVDRIIEGRGKLQHKLEGMRSSLEDDTPGSATLFAWNTVVFANKMLQNMKIEENLVFPKLSKRLDSARDQQLADSLNLDQAVGIEHYAQAEGVLQILERMITI